MARNLPGINKHLVATPANRPQRDSRERQSYTVRLPIELIDELDELIARRDLKAKYPNRSDFLTVAAEALVEAEKKATK